MSLSNLKQDDVRKGMLVTIMNGLPVVAPVAGGIVHVLDKALNGQAMEILSVDLPFVAAVLLHPRYKGAVVSIDMRDVMLKVLSKQYVKAITNDVKVPTAGLRSPFDMFISSVLNEKINKNSPPPADSTSNKP